MNVVNKKDTPRTAYHDLLAPWTRNVIGPLWARWDRSLYLRILRRLSQTQFDSPESILQRQWKRIESLLYHAYETVPHWKTTFDTAGLQPEDIKTWEDFTRLPVLEKSDLRANNDQLRSSMFTNSSQLHRKSTSGSTGTTVVVYVDDACQDAFVRDCVSRVSERGRLILYLYRGDPGEEEILASWQEMASRLPVAAHSFDGAFLRAIVLRPTQAVRGNHGF